MKADRSYVYDATAHATTLPDRQSAQDVLPFTVSDGQTGTMTATLTVTIAEKKNTTSAATTAEPSHQRLDHSNLNNCTEADILTDRFVDDVAACNARSNTLTDGPGEDTLVFNL